MADFNPFKIFEESRRLRQARRDEDRVAWEKAKADREAWEAQVNARERDAIIASGRPLLETEIAQLEKRDESK